MQVVVYGVSGDSYGARGVRVQGSRTKSAIIAAVTEKETIVGIMIHMAAIKPNTTAATLTTIDTISNNPAGCPPTQSSSGRFEL